MSEKEVVKIKKSDVIFEVVQKYPKTAEVFGAHGFHCLGCPAAAGESIEMGAKTHGMKDADIEKFVKALNGATGSEESD